MLIRDSASAKKTSCLVALPGSHRQPVLPNSFPTLSEILMKTSNPLKPKLLPQPNMRLIPPSFSDHIMRLLFSYVKISTPHLECTRYERDLPSYHFCTFCKSYLSTFHTIYNKSWHRLIKRKLATSDPKSPGDLLFLESSPISVYHTIIP